MWYVYCWRHGKQHQPHLFVYFLFSHFFIHISTTISLYFSIHKNMFPCYPHSSSGGLKMFAFTSSQWEEFQRQALIYKYIIRCVPVPSHLLFPSTPAVYFSGGSSMDPEPGRCRRTDGKKWRCAKDAAPEQKYCEKHLIRNRPRSRKLVEQRKTKQKCSGGSSSTNAEDSVDSIKTAIELNDSVQAKKFGEEKGYIEWTKSSYSETQGSEEQPDALYPCINTGLKFNTIGTHSVMQRYTELPNLNYDDTNNIWKPFIHSSGSADCDKQPQTYFDAWSTENNSANLPLPTLSLSIPTAVGEDYTQDMKSRQLYNWMGLDSTVGGPLAEVLHSSNLTSHESSPRESFVSSPSGVLQKAIATLSDSSGSSSPTFVGRWMNLNK